MMKVSEILPKRLREAHTGEKGREFALRCGVKPQQLSRYERVGGQLPGAETLATFARMAGVSADWLLGLTDERTPGANQAPTLATPEQRAAIEEGARMGAELLPVMRDVLHILAANGANASRIAALESRLAALEAHPLANARGVASSRSSTAIDA